MGLSRFPGECVAEVSRSLWDVEDGPQTKERRFELELWSCLKEAERSDMEDRGSRRAPLFLPTVNAVFRSNDAGFNALWRLQWGTALLFVRGPTAAALRRSALHRRVAGVRVVGVFPQGTGPGAKDEPSAGEERAPQQRQPAAGAAETRFHSVPVLTLVGHLTLVDT